ncbi:MAG: LPS export ABC transporter periplasmic protein LptC [Kiritimatiellaeota bacterium]|nr:LPS export ABC transporter periplasmic protein LptC [Kiritimatiellota bacterium]
MNRRRINRARRVAGRLAVLLATGAVGGFAARAGPSVADTELVITRFKTRGADDRGAVSWELQGAEARMAGGKARIRDVTVVFSPREPDRRTRMTSPYCVLDRETRTISSRAPLRVENAGFILDGIGYDILTAQQKLFIRNKVRMQVKATAEAFGRVTKNYPHKKTVGARPPDRTEEGEKP